MMHAVDWLPTILGFLNISTNDTIKAPLDGVNQWKSITENKESPRNEILLNTIKNQVDAYLMGDWKYVNGSNIGSYDGWVHVPNTTYSCIHCI